MGNAYLWDVRALKDKWSIIYDNICASQAKFILAF